MGFFHTHGLVVVLYVCRYGVQRAVDFGIVVGEIEQGFRQETVAEHIKLLGRIRQINDLGVEQLVKNVSLVGVFDSGAVIHRAVVVPILITVENEAKWHRLGEVPKIGIADDEEVGLDGRGVVVKLGDGIVVLVGLDGAPQIEKAFEVVVGINGFVFVFFSNRVISQVHVALVFYVALNGIEGMGRGDVGPVLAGFGI